MLRSDLQSEDDMNPLADTRDPIGESVSALKPSVRGRKTGVHCRSIPWGVSVNVEKKEYKSTLDRPIYKQTPREIPSGVASATSFCCLRLFVLTSSSKRSAGRINRIHNCPAPNDK
ncbi:hypothetical protein PAMP_023876 [Pampus punctatissimus]